MLGFGRPTSREIILDHINMTHTRLNPLLSTEIIKIAQKLVDKETPSLMYLQNYWPQEVWFAHPSQIHGINHSVRVLILQEILALHLIKSDCILDQEALRWAAATHDIGRIDDGLDLDHNERSGHLAQEYLKDIVPEEVIKEVQYLNRWHNINEELIPNLTNELKVLKDADSLDRVRLSDLDIRYLHFPQAKELVSFAKLFFLAYSRS